MPRDGCAWQVGDHRLKRSAIVAVAALAVFVVTAPQVVSATDYGPQNAIAELQYDVPRLLAQSLGSVRPLFLRSTSPNYGTLVLDMVYTDGAQAAVSWHAGHARGLIILRFSRGMWWWAGGAATVNNELTYWTSLSSPGQDVTECSADRLHSPTADEILSSNLISEPFARGLAHYLKVWHAAVAPGRLITSCDYYPFGNASDGYVAYLVTGPLEWKSLREWASMRGSVPPASQMPPVYYAVTLSTRSSSPVKINAGSTLRVWFPFVLDTEKRYRLLLQGANPSFEAVVGSLKNNTLTFTFPAFLIPAGSTLHGEITGE
jgi:hypothetical protein